jgi:ABC-type nitrate/sulfonate/bicarbonate transport system ATPase subunit
MSSKIAIRSISKSFGANGTKLPVVADFSLEIGAGELVAIVGPSGCGKSTLMGMAAGFIAADAGSVLIDGRQLSRPDPRGILISQQSSVFPWLTVRENVMFGLNGHAVANKQELADKYAAIVGLNGFEESYPHQISTGMLKRAEIARALAVKPQILYMDEPFSALDALLSLRMRNELLRILAAERPTVMLITHDVEEAIHLADRIVVLSPRPASIREIFAVPFPHPRRLASAPVQELRIAVLSALGVDALSV